MLAHNVHPTGRELDGAGAAGAAVAHCPTSNSALGSGLFPLREHLALGVRVALGSDVGAGTGFSMFKEGLQAYFAQQLLGRDRRRADIRPPAPPDDRGRRGRARARGHVGDFSVGKEFDAVWLRPDEGSALEMSFRHAHSAEDALAKAFAMAGSSDVAGVWIGGGAVER